jgi:hypothetical protein
MRTSMTRAASGEAERYAQISAVMALIRNATHYNAIRDVKVCSLMG